MGGGGIRVIGSRGQQKAEAGSGGQATCSRSCRQQVTEAKRRAPKIGGRRQQVGAGYGGQREAPAAEWQALEVRQWQIVVDKRCVPEVGGSR